MFKKKKKNQKEFKEIEFVFEKDEEKKPEIPVRIAEEDDYAVLEPLDIWTPKKTSIEKKPIISKEVIEIKKKKPKEQPIEEHKKEEKLEEKKEEAKHEEVKPKLIIQKTQPKEIKIESDVQKVSPKPTEEITKTEESISEIPLNHIETDIDKLIEIIDEKKTVGLEYLSKSLKISVDRLENWAKILEDRGLIEIEYPIIGLPKLRKKECKKES